MEAPDPDPMSPKTGGGGGGRRGFWGLTTRANSGNVWEPNKSGPCKTSFPINPISLKVPYQTPRRLVNHSKTPSFPATEFTPNEWAVVSQRPSDIF